jgi:hypothetical protein
VIGATEPGSGLDILDCEPVPPANPGVTSDVGGLQRRRVLLLLGAVVDAIPT